MGEGRGGSMWSTFTRENFSTVENCRGKKYLLLYLLLKTLRLYHKVYFLFPYILRMR